MNLDQIIAKIQASGIEGSEAIAKAINEYFSSLTADFDEKTGVLNAQIDNLTTAIGISEGTTTEKLAAAKNALGSLTKERDELKTKAELLETTVARNQRQQIVNSAAAVAKADPVVLSTILGDAELKVDGDKVTVGDRSLTDWAKAEKAPFMAALFPTVATNKLPGSPPHQQPTSDKTESQEPKSPADSYFDSYYKKPSFIQ